MSILTGYVSEFSIQTDTYLNFITKRILYRFAPVSNRILISPLTNSCIFVSKVLKFALSDLSMENFQFLFIVINKEVAYMAD